MTKRRKPQHADPRQRGASRKASARDAASPISRLTVKQVLYWADLHEQRTGSWPTRQSRGVYDAPDESWDQLDAALQSGRRGLRGRSSLAWILYKHREVLWYHRYVPITLSRILRWADEHHRRTGSWPRVSSGRARGSPGLTWRVIDHALGAGQRGLRGDTTLARMLEARRGVRNMQNLPKLTQKQILTWADRHRENTDQWPTHHSGSVIGEPDEWWRNVDNALRYGLRGMPGGSSVVRLLAGKRGHRNMHGLPALSEARILKWADAHFRRTGRWPTTLSGIVAGSRNPVDTWNQIDGALTKGWRDLPGGSSLALLLAANRDKRHLHRQPRLTFEIIAGWMKAHHRRTGEWPLQSTGRVVGAPGEKWRNLNNALTYGLRGMPRGSSLAVLRKELEAHTR